MESKKDTLHTLFVYGTLKRGFGLNHVLKHSEFLGTAVTEPMFKLYDNGSYPYLQECPGGYEVTGEVYRVNEDVLRTCDQIEFGAGYERHEIRVTGAPLPGAALQAFAYLIPEYRKITCPEATPQGEFVR